MIGTTKCGTCAREIPVREGKGGALNLSCAWCDVKKYAAKGTDGYRLESARIVPSAKPEPAPVADKKEEAAPVRPEKKSGFKPAWT